jgi:hypothetical protein
MNIQTITIATFALVTLLSCSLTSSERSSGFEAIRNAIIEAEKNQVLELAKTLLDAEPVTVTAASSERSAGRINDYFSEGTYWWPDPENPEGPYIRKDGIVNPDNFTYHLDAMKRLSIITGTLTSAYLLTGERQYAEQTMVHLNAWFVDPATRMNPHLLYAQAITGIVTGRGIGIIDAVHLIDVAKSAKILSQSPYTRQEDIVKVREWFSEFIHWLKTHPYGIEEMNWRNNHGTWWHTQVAAFAGFTGDNETLEFVRERMKTILIPNQMASDGSFPLELERTRPYGYSFFNINGMALLAHILSKDNENENMWDFRLEDGRGMEIAVEFIHYYTKSKNEWPLEPDVDYWDELPGREPYLLLAALGYKNMDFFNTWKNIPVKPLSHEGMRNLPMKNILLWIGLPNPN